jgi:hypothetical protein
LDYLQTKPEQKAIKHWCLRLYIVHFKVTRRMIERRGNVSFSVISQDQKGRPFPEISKNGVTYVVARFGKSFQVKVVRMVRSTPGVAAPKISIK